MPDDALPVPLDDLLAHREWVRRVAWALTRDAHDAEDVEQATWLAAVRTPPTHRASLRGWLGTTVRRAAGRLRRSRARRDAAVGALAAAHGVAYGAAAGDVAELAARADLHRRVVEALVALDEPYRGTLLLRLFEGLPVAEVAARTGVPLETARARLRRGIETLRGRFRERDGDLAALALLAAAPGRGGGASSSTATGAAATATGGLVMGAKTWAAAAAVLLLAIGGAWWATHGDDAPRETATAPATPAPVAARTGTPRAPSRPRAAQPTPPAPVAAAPAPVLPPPPPADAKARLLAARVTLRWEGVGMEPALATLASETGVPIVVPKSALATFANIQINLTLTDVSALNALRTTCKCGGLVEDVQADRVVVRLQSAAPADEGELVPVRRLEDLPHATAVVHVTDAGGVPLAGAEVLSGHSGASFGTTDSAGALTVRRPIPFPWVLARVAGRVDAPPTRVPAEADATVDVTLRMGGTAARVHGTLRTDDGRAVVRHFVALAVLSDDGRVHLGGHALLTDDAGAFDDRSCTPGHVVLTAQAEGYAFTQREFDVAPGDDTAIDVVLPREAVCAGLVRSVGGAPAPEVRVTASIPSRPGVAVAFTDPNGRYRLVGLPAGRITIEAQDVRARTSARTEIDVAAGEAQTWDAQLEPAAK